MRGGPGEVPWPVGAPWAAQDLAPKSGPTHHKEGLDGGWGAPHSPGGLTCFASCHGRSMASGPVLFSWFAVPGLAVCVASQSLLSSVPGRVSFFTSGSENLHRVEKVHWGTRYAVTIAFTCNPDHGIADPVFT